MNMYFLLNKNMSGFEAVLTACRAQNALYAEEGQSVIMSIQNAYYDPHVLVKVGNVDQEWLDLQTWLSDCVAIWEQGVPEDDATRLLWAQAQAPEFTPDTVADRQAHWSGGE